MTTRDLAPRAPDTTLPATGPLYVAARLASHYRLEYLMAAMAVTSAEAVHAARAELDYLRTVAREAEALSVRYRAAVSEARQGA